ncbi:MAG: T9SS type A sorting domain-containing protein [Bacteroidales bacterium]|nr:T9SS type A sorting domain-containing protein [Bacteroidales bacterium]MCF8391782.1 T9SS type A sorting domain-containing protein [Bacteroidales bacterium]
MYSQDPNFHIYLCFGQSNMEGQGIIETKDKTVDSRFQVMEAVNCSNLGRTKGSWYKAVPPLCRCWSGLSPADYFGRTMVENLPPEVRIGIVNVSVAGCKIELFDKDNYQTYAATVESWMTNIINEYGGNPYARLIEIARLAQADGVIKGILLHQGESNTGDKGWPAKVKVVYDNLMSDLNLNPDSIPLIAGEVVNADQGGICASMNSIIAKLPQTIPNSYVISSSGCTDASDNLHFDSEGYRVLGTRYAMKMLSLLGYENTNVEFEKINGYELSQNYPNPFTKKTNISFEIPHESYISLKVYSIIGEDIAELAGKEYLSGKHTIEFNTGNLSQGNYIYRLEADQFSSTREMIIIDDF